MLGSDTGEEVYRSWTYKDGSQRLARIRAGTSPGGDGISDFRHFYDAVGNVVKLNDENHGAGGQLQCFSYDDLNRLEGAFTSNDCDSGYNGSVGTGPYQFWYDYSPIGSVMKLRDTEGGTVLADWDYGDTSVGAGAYAADDWNPDPGAAVAIGYDESGNMISKGADSLVWDADNRLHTYDAATGTDTGFVYDADGNRILRIHGTITTTYIGDLYESDGTTSFSEGDIMAGGGALIVEERAYHRAHPGAGHWINGTEPMGEAVSVDGADQLALDVADLVQSGLGVGRNLDV